MTTLTTAPVAALIDRLFEDASGPASPQLRSAIDAGSTDYREFYAAARDDYLAVSRETGRLLYLAAGLRYNGGGRLITSEFEPSKVERARANFVVAGLDDLIEVREGDALQTLSKD